MIGRVSVAPAIHFLGIDFLPVFADGVREDFVAEIPRCGLGVAQASSSCSLPDPSWYLFAGPNESGQYSPLLSECPGEAAISSL
jgi:hypothetical protein